MTMFRAVLAAMAAMMPLAAAPALADPAPTLAANTSPPAGTFRNTRGTRLDCDGKTVQLHAIDGHLIGKGALVRGTSGWAFSIQGHPLEIVPIDADHFDLHIGNALTDRYTRIR